MRSAHIPGNPPTVAVIGSGFAGLLTAIHLLAADARMHVRLVEKAPQFRRGRAYEPASPGHLLNVRVANMSAFPDRPNHFRDWLAARALPHDEDAFVGRALYGDYLQELLRDAVLEAAGRLLLEQDEAIAVVPAGGRHAVRLAVGRSFEADVVVIALGLGPPALPSGVDPDVLSSRTYVADPWRMNPDALPDGSILLIGAGLTMLDVALSLERPGRDIVALSRHGLLPRPHGPAPPAPAPDGPLDTPLRALRTLRRQARAVGWRSAVDSIRPLVADTWANWALPERERFLRHLQPWWDVHRHRTAPEAATRAARPMWDERFAVMAGRVERLTATVDGRFRAQIRLRGRVRSLTKTFAAVVNCTGLSGDLATSPLLGDLRRRGAIRRDPLGLGLDVARDGQAIGAEGQPSDGLYVVGPLTRAVRWEATAVPDLRNDTARVARTVTELLRLRGHLGTRRRAAVDDPTYIAADRGRHS